MNSVHNFHERPVIQSILDNAPQYPALANRPELLGDVACIALNRIPSRYVRNDVDMLFYMGEAEIIRQKALIEDAVAYAFNFVISRMARE
jgi:hypothetical protein